MMLYGPLLVWVAVALLGPYDVTQGQYSKLLYVHVPTVWIAYYLPYALLRYNNFNIFIYKHIFTKE